ncbi:MAG: hypothetical protein NTX52_15665 [Planctomycetota bacterium]|nr:hypothetical protein [Planctomycetota bacterium]
MTIPDASQNQYQNKIVAFLDILGFRQKVFQDTPIAIKTIKQIDEDISHVIEMVKQYGPTSISIKLFSDCFCISCDSSELDLLITELSFLQLFLSAHNIFVRGAISQGRHFENEHIIFSEGLVNAYELQNADRFPRIKIDEIIPEGMKEKTDSFFVDRLADYLIVAPDGVCFLDYLQALTWEGVDAIKDDLFKDHKKAITDEVERNRGNYNVIEKYKWLAEYHNTKFYQLYDLDDYYEEYQKEMLNEMCISSDIFPSFKIGALNFSKINPNSA